MTFRQFFNSYMVAATVIVSATTGAMDVFAAPPEQADAVEGVEVLTRGPVHEAFAEAVTFDPQPGVVVSKEPPDLIEELPPNQKPDGANVAWIPGYWAWDEDREDFLWVSGTWRALPPGREWVPGYWAKSDDGFQWISGYWADADQSEIQYLPEPPATVETGPSGSAPSADQIWVPGNWVWNQNRYVWQPGYWAPAQQNWLWVPSHYQYSPRGYVFVNGYYDYSLARRGILFAPVYFNSGVYSQQGFSYSPAIAISQAVFGNQLFVRSNYGHYYFGDYYGSGYANAGYYPWFSFNSGGYGYDPFYAQQSWQNRQQSGWAKSLQADYQNRVDNEDARPPRTFADQQALLKKGKDSNDKQVAMAMPLDQLAKSKDESVKLQDVSKDEREELVKQQDAVQKFRSDRQKMEAKSADSSDEKPNTESTKQSEAVTAKRAQSPIQARQSDKLAKEDMPPKAHETPKSDPKVEPKPRQAVGKGKTPTAVKTAKPELPDGDSKPAPKSGSRPTPKSAPKTSPNADPKAVPKAGTRPESPKAEPKPTPRPEPKAPRVEPNPANPPAAPKVDPKPSVPKVGPKPVPKAEPGPAPRGEPKPAPRPAPKVEPKPKQAGPGAAPQEKPKK